jgi:nucleotide-binding universal stress UspA family protein
MFKHILVPLDGSSLAESVLPHVVALAQPFDSQVIVMRVVEQPQGEERSQAVDPLGWQMRKAEAESYLDEVSARLKDLDLNVKKVLAEGRAAKRIVAYTRENDVDLLVMSSHGRSGLSEWNINSVVQKVILRVYMPTLIIRAYQPAPQELTDLEYHRILIPLDGSRRAENLLPLARSITNHHTCRIILAHVVARPEVPRRAPLKEQEQALVDRLTELNRKHGKEYLEDLKSRLTAEVQTRLLVSENPAAALHDLVEEEEVDMVLLSAHGYSGEARWPYGSIALNFIAYGTKPLLIVQDLSREEIEESAAEKAVSEEKGH